MRLCTVEISDDRYCLIHLRKGEKSPILLARTTQCFMPHDVSMCIIGIFFNTKLLRGSVENCAS